MKQLVCISHSPWSSTPTRTQQFMTRMKDVSILFLELTGSRPSRQQGCRVRSNIIVYSLPISAYRHLDSRFLQRHAALRLNHRIVQIMHKHRFKEPTLWPDSPHLFTLPTKLNHHGLIYDCAREWDDLPLDWESELSLHADVVFVASAGLADRLSPCCDNIAIIPNGVNYPMFSCGSAEPPPALRRIHTPVFARVGAVTEDLDLTPLLHAASARPEWTFLLIGPVAPAVRSSLSRCRNILLPGRVPMVEVPDYLNWCHVQFDLLSRQNAGSDLLPSHFYEYLAVGKPIVMMIVPEQIEPFPDVVYTASTPSAFLRLCEKALAEDPTWLRTRRQAYAQEAQWSKRIAEIQQILETGVLL